MPWTKPERGSEVNQMDLDFFIHSRDTLCYGKFINLRRKELKKKIPKILGVAVTLGIVLSFVAALLPTAALANPAETLNEWYTFDYPVAGADGDWFYSPDIDGMREITEAINGDLYVYAYIDDTHEILKSTDGGRTWAITGYSDPDDGVVGGRVFDMVCSSIDEDVVYATDGCYVYKTEDGGDTWDWVAQDSLETALGGGCGCTICECTDPDWRVITSLDVTYDDDDNPFVFIGTRAHDITCGPPCADTLPESDPDFPGDVLYIGEAGYPANWTSLNLPCFHDGGYDAIAIGCAPDWADSKKTYVVVTTDDDDSLPGTSHTWVVYTKGTVCGWYEFAELLWDCIPAGATGAPTDGNFESWAASRIGFPDDWEDSETLFVGVTTLGSYGGDVYMATEDGAFDLNVEGIETGCVGDEPDTDIISLDVMGDTDEASLIAGAFSTTDVYYSTDGGWSWDASEKNPTGERWTYVIFYEDTALAATWGCESAVSMSCISDDVEDVGEAWNQISLIATAIDCVIWGDHSPGYLSADSETMYMLTECSDCCGDGTHSLFRNDGTYWERVFCSTIADYSYDTAFEMVEVSPDFDTTNVVYLFNNRLEGWRTTDAGCSWDKLSFPCSPRPHVSAGVVIDEDTVIAGGAGSDAGIIFKTTRHGARPWDKYDVDTAVGDAVSFDLEPGYEDPGTVLFGDDMGQVWISEDGGETWDLVGTGTTTGCKAVLGANNAWVAFDPGYATNHIIYAAAGDNIARCVIDPDEDWVDQEWDWLCGEAGDEYIGIETVGDTALYVTAGCESIAGRERAVEVDGTIAVRCPETGDTADLIIDNIVVGEISGAFEPDELVSVIEYNLVYTDRCNGEGCAAVSGDVDVEGVYVSGPIPLKGVTSMGTNTLTLVNDGVTVTSGTFIDGEVVDIASLYTSGDLEFDDRPGTDRVEGTLDVVGFTSGATGTVDVYYEIEDFMTGGADEDLDLNPPYYIPGVLITTILGTFTVDECVVTSGAFDDGEDVDITDSNLVFDDRPIMTDQVEGTIQIEGVDSGATGTVAVDYHEENFMPYGDASLQVVDSDLVAEVFGLEGEIGLKGVDSGATGTISIYACVDLGDEDQVVEVISSHLTADVTGEVPAIAGKGGVLRSLNPGVDEEGEVIDAEDVVFERLTEGLDCCIYGLAVTHDVSDDGCAENVLWTLSWECCDDVWVYEDTLAQPVVLTSPVDGAKLAKADEATLSWEELCGADCYEVSLYAYCAECPDNKLTVDLSDLAAMDCCPYDDVVCGDTLKCPNDVCTEDTCITVDDLDPGTTYYWQVRVCQGKPTLSKWSVERSFTTALSAVEFEKLCSPACGAQDIILTPNFAWGAVDGATSYEVELSTAETFAADVVKGKTTVNAWVCPTTLDYATTYYWRVRAVKDGTYSDWTYCMFTTMPEPVAPTPPVVVEQVPPAAPPVINIPPATMITPTWIYAIIGVGAALAIVVIVLIVRTRRPPA
jgi:hypothetical protein